MQGCGSKTVVYFAQAQVEYFYYVFVFLKKQTKNSFSKPWLANTTWGSKLWKSSVVFTCDFQPFSAGSGLCPWSRLYPCMAGALVQGEAHLLFVFGIEKRRKETLVTSIFCCCCQFCPYSDHNLQNVTLEFYFQLFLC